MIEVIRAGLLTTVQDLGRPGFRHLGIATGGALDPLALEVGNRLVGNRADAAGLEVTFGPVVLRFARATRLAITGAEFGATLDGRPLYAWWSLPVAAGGELVLNGARRGMRAYVCVAGGIDVLPMLGSRSTDLGARFGGLAGRALKDGDRLALGTSAAKAPYAGGGYGAGGVGGVMSAMGAVGAMGAMSAADAMSTVGAADAGAVGGGGGAGGGNGANGTNGASTMNTASDTGATVNPPRSAIGTGSAAGAFASPRPGAVPSRERAALAPGAPAFGVKAPGWCSFARVDEPHHRRGRHADGLAWAVPVRVLRGPEYDSFAPEAQRAFWSDEWLVTPNSNRMGYRLQGTTLEREPAGELLSHAVLPGTIQVPPNGQPIVLMNDAQTTGGYPKIGVVIRADLWKLAQLRLNGGVRFVETTRAGARRALEEERAYLRQIDAAIAMHDDALKTNRETP